jgi:hypothetical protein
VVQSGKEPREVTEVREMLDATDTLRRARGERSRTAGEDRRAARGAGAKVNARLRAPPGGLAQKRGDPMPFCLIEEKTFSGGGHVVNFEQLVEWLGLPHLVEGAATPS